MPPAQLPPRQLPPGTIVTQDNCQLGQMPPMTTATYDNCYPRGVVRRERVATAFPHFSCLVWRAMKVNTSLKYWCKNEFKVLLKMASFMVYSYTSFFNTAPMCHVPPGQLPTGIMRFTHYIQATKFNSEYRVATRGFSRHGDWEPCCFSGRSPNLLNDVQHIFPGGPRPPSYGPGATVVQHSAAKVSSNIVVAAM